MGLLQIPSSALLKEQGNRAFLKGNCTEAIRCYKEALVNVQDNSLKVILLSNLSQCYLNQELYEEALEYSTNALKIDPNFWKALFRKGKALARLNQFEESDKIMITINTEESLKQLKFNHRMKQQIKENISEPKNQVQNYSQKSEKYNFAKNGTNILDKSIKYEIPDIRQLIVSFLPDLQMTQLQQLNRQAYNKGTYVYEDRNSMVGIKRNQESNMHLYHFKWNKIYKMNLGQMLEQQNPRWLKLKPKYLTRNYGNRYQPHSIQINENRLIVFHDNDVNLQVHLNQKIVDNLPKSGVERVGFGMMYRKNHQFLWVVGGAYSLNYDSSNPVNAKQVRRFDLVNLKWDSFKNNIHSHWIPGCLISSDSSYLWVFSIDKLERLSLKNPEKGWDQIQTQINFGIWIKSIPHPSRPNQFYVAGSYGFDIYEIEGQNNQQCLVKYQSLSMQKPSDGLDGFYFSNPIIFQNKLIGLGDQHIHTLDLKTRKSAIKMNLGISSIKQN